MSGLDELTREGLIALVIRQHETIEAQAKRIAELEAIVQSQSERIGSGVLRWSMAMKQAGGKMVSTAMCGAFRLRWCAFSHTITAVRHA